MTVEKDSFGPPLWQSIHFIALGYPKEPSENDKNNYATFYNNLPNVIPCYECSQHLRENLKKSPIRDYLESRENLFEWTIKLHNVVNEMLNKPTWELQDAFDHYLTPSNFKVVKRNRHSSK